MIYNVVLVLGVLQIDSVTYTHVGLPGGTTIRIFLSTQETWVRSLGWEDTLEKGMAIYFSILAWRIPWTEELGRL